MEEEEEKEEEEEGDEKVRKDEGKWRREGNRQLIGEQKVRREMSNTKTTKPFFLSQNNANETRAC